MNSDSLSSPREVYLNSKGVRAGTRFIKDTDFWVFLTSCRSDNLKSDQIITPPKQTTQQKSQRNTHSFAHVIGVSSTELKWALSAVAFLLLQLGLHILLVTVN